VSDPLNIAIVGIGGMLPGARHLDEFWSNVVAGRDCSRDVPADRWPADPQSVLQPGGPAADKVYSLRGYFLDSVPRDPKVDPALDPLFHLAVSACRQAWTDAVTNGVDCQRVGVVLGSIALPTQKISQLSREVLGSYFRGEPATASTVDARNVAVVGLPAALVADVLQFGGLTLTLDAACASSLYALKIACDELTSGRADAMLAGGLNRSDSLYTQMGFSQLRALSPTGRCSPLDARADGLLVGEGGVVFVLKRLTDAERDGDRIYGVIRGIGLSNDVGGGILAPASEGQLRAMRAAYEQAGWRPGDVDFIECHATGTPVGDAVELASLRELWRDELRRCVLGAVKSTVGHLLTGAGAASLLKVLLAMRHQTLPPTANLQSPASGEFEVLSSPRKWIHRCDNVPRRAAINAFGFGGVNAHVLIEEHLAASLARRSARASQASRPNRAIAIVGIADRFESRIESVSIALDRVRTPPSELHACLPQQLVLLQVVADAIDDAGGLVDPVRTGAFIGIALDINTTNYDFRWSLPPAERDRICPSLTADRVMGSLGSIAASRVARAFDCGGPSFALSAEEASGMVGLHLAMEALRRGELMQAMVGAVDLPDDPRLDNETCSEGAAALILMRLDDAERFGMPIHAIIDDSQAAAIAVDAADEFGHIGAATAMASLVKACRITESDRFATVVRSDKQSAVFQPGASARMTQLTRRAGRLLDIPAQRLPFVTPRPDFSFSPRSMTGGEPSAPLEDSNRGVTAMIGAMAEAHQTFLRLTQSTYEQIAQTIDLQSAVLQRMVHDITGFDAPERRDDVFLDRDGCLEFAHGKIGDVLGSEFASLDQYPTRVRLPDEPLMLVDRIVSIEGEKRSLSRGRIVTEHDVHAERWYLDNGIAPPSIAIESGQADLFLAAWLGVDFHTKGRAVYRLLDAAVTFHRELPRVGETVRYDIRIKEFFRQGETLLFRFEFDGAIDGQPLLTMRDGCAGFFTPEELAAGQGVVKTAMQSRPMAGKAPANWRPPMSKPESYSESQLDALRRGDLPEFNNSSFRSPLTLPLQDKLRLIHRVTQFDPRGGRFGLGLIRGEADIHPDDWFLICHFVDDQVMPGTLMYECCLHTLRIAMLRFGWIGDSDQCTYQPVIGVTSRLKCRGQVTATTKTVAYEVSIKEINDGPEPYAIADALMFADGKPIVDVQDMTLRLAGALRSEDSASRLNSPLFSREQILEFATGSPSRAFGDEYAPFDGDRFIARLPAPPYSFLDRIVSATVEPWAMKAGGIAVAEYDVPSDAWYFARQAHMPYAVLLETALQACGWVSAYIGSALHSDEDLHYRNLGGRGTVLRIVGPEAGTLTTTVTLTRVSKSAGMIIQHFDFVVRDANGRDVCVGDTYFGFFTSAALSDQVGMREAKPFEPVGKGEKSSYPASSPFPDAMLRMIDHIDCWSPTGGPHGLGLIRGSKDVDPNGLFFKAHFHQDPVWPGSLGLEAFLQLLQVAAVRMWGISSKWESPSLGSEHHWTYRGQVLPSDRRVTVQAEITKIDDTAHALLADGWLLVDDRVIYQMKDFAFRHTT
jgi:3-oxoacyl-(acyl-carrier-protein) synthase/3-hydroxymyristoyl/3-hydroxydecanoyl-(acyl carrier protein) dehydratase